MGTPLQLSNMFTPLLISSFTILLAVGTSAESLGQPADYSGDLPPVYPWLASVLIDDFFYCEGYLISARHILITANCVAGGTYFDTQLSTATVWVHPGYNETYFVDNIALL